MFGALAWNVASDLVFLTKYQSLQWYQACRTIRRWEHSRSKTEIYRSIFNDQRLGEAPWKISQLISLVSLWKVISLPGDFSIATTNFDVSVFLCTLYMAAICAKYLESSTVSSGRTFRLTMTMRGVLSYCFYANLHRPLRLGKSTVLAPLRGSQRNLVSTVERSISFNFMLLSVSDIFYSLLIDLKHPKLSIVTVHRWTLSLCLLADSILPLFLEMLEFLKDLRCILLISHRYDGLGSRWQRYLRLFESLAGNWQSGNSGLLQALRTRQVANPKDKAYSMYGVLQALGAQLTPPNYSRLDTTIFEDFFVDLIQWRSAMFGLLIDAGTCRREEQGDHAPTWVPNWQGRVQLSWIPDDELYITFGSEQMHHTRTCGFPLFSIKGSALTVWFQKIDRVTTCYVL